MPFLSLILNNWKSLLLIGATAFIGFALHQWNVSGMEARHKAQLEEQAAGLAAQCEADKKTTQEAYNALKTKTDALSSRIAALKLRRPSRCVAVSASKPAAEHDGSPTGEKPVGRDGGITTDALIDFSGKAESYRLRLLACQDFVRTIQKEAE